MGFLSRDFPGRDRDPPADIQRRHQVGRVRRLSETISLSFLIQTHKFHYAMENESGAYKLNCNDRLAVYILDKPAGT